MNTDDGYYQVLQSKLAAENLRREVKEKEEESGSVSRPHDILYIGQKVTIDNSLFEVEKIELKHVTLKVLPTPTAGRTIREETKYRIEPGPHLSPVAAEIMSKMVEESTQRCLEKEIGKNKRLRAALEEIAAEPQRYTNMDFRQIANAALEDKP